MTTFLKLDLTTFKKLSNLAAGQIIQMTVTVKNKIWLGTVFLFLMLILIGTVCIYYLVRIKNDAKDVMENNFESLKYCNAMQKQLDSTNTNYALSVKKFEAELLRQENNITEPGEREATRALRTYFENLRREHSAINYVTEIRQQLENIVQLNMKAIQEKKKEADEPGGTRTLNQRIKSPMLYH